MPVRSISETWMVLPSTVAVARFEGLHSSLSAWRRRVVSLLRFRREPGSPQRPITAWVSGHGDEQALRVQEVYGRLEAYAEENLGEVGYRRIVEELAPHL